MKVIDYLTTQAPPSPHVANSHPKGVYSYCNPSIEDPKRHYGFKLGLLGKIISLGVDVSNWEMFDDDWGLESKKVSPLGEELSLFDRPNKVERGRKAHLLEDKQISSVGVFDEVGFKRISLKGFAAALAVLLPERLKADNTISLAVDSISALLLFGDWRLEQTATFSISTIFE
ncbi:hypothetical protein Tco_1162802 [Tanacetum coccineum]